jgi:hypothetical protein
MTDEQMIADGWRRCAVGQRTTQHCGMAEEARTQERQRMVALIREELAQWRDGPELAHWEDLPDDSGEELTLKRLLRQVEDTSHE